MKDGVLVVDKPQGPTSHDVVQRIRHALKVDRAGHTGTLDPMATGVLPVCLGEATKLVQLLLGEDKAYEATVALGIATDTLDAQGKPTATAEVPERLDVESALSKFRGTFLQQPPMFSAVKVKGRKLYQAAREGVEVEREARPVTVTRLELLELTPTALRLQLECSKGFYVRVLAAELAQALGTVGHLSQLRRTRSGRFDIGQAVPLEQACLGAGIVSVEEAVAHLPSVKVGEADARRVKSGGRVAAAPTQGPVCVLGPNGALLAIADVEQGLLKYRRVMA